MSRAEMSSTGPAVLDYTSMPHVRPWPVPALVAQFFTPFFAAVLARIISNNLHSKWGIGYPNRSQILEHIRFAEDVPFLVGTGLLLLITIIGVVHGIRSRSRWLPVVVCAPIALVAIVFGVMLAVPYY